MFPLRIRAGLGHLFPLGQRDLFWGSPFGDSSGDSTKDPPVVEGGGFGWGVLFSFYRGRFGGNRQCRGVFPALPFRAVALGEGSDFVEGFPSLLVGWGGTGVWGL